MSNADTSDVQWEDEQPLTASPADANGVIWEDEQPGAGGLASSPSNSGQTVNDVGNLVLTPKDGEKYTDTLNRIIAQGKKTTPEMINKEIATVPKKAATVLAAAPVIGAAGAGAGAATGAGPAAIEMLEAAAKAHPFVAHIVAKGIEGLGIGGGLAPVKKLLQ